MQALGLLTGAILLLQHGLQSQGSPLLSRRAAAPPHLSANLTSQEQVISRNSTNEPLGGVELEIRPFPIFVSHIDPSKFDGFMDAAERKIKNDIQTHRRYTPVATDRWELTASDVAVLLVKDVHYRDQLTYEMIDMAMTDLFRRFPSYDFRESNLKLFEGSDERRLISRGYIAKTVRGSRGSSLVDPGDASMNSVSVTR